MIAISFPLWETGENFTGTAFLFPVSAKKKL
jgi:hypothetical protein